MSHHTIYCRLGPSDAASAGSLRSDTVLSDIGFIDDAGNLSFGPGSALAQLDAMGLTPSEVAVDPTLLATALTAADTRPGALRLGHRGWRQDES